MLFIDAVRDKMEFIYSKYRNNCVALFIFTTQLNFNRTEWQNTVFSLEVQTNVCK